MSPRQRTGSLAGGLRPVSLAAIPKWLALASRPLDALDMALATYFVSVLGRCHARTLI